MNARSIRRRTGSSLSARLMLALVAVALLMSLVPLTGGSASAEDPKPRPVSPVTNLQVMQPTPTPTPELGEPPQGGQPFVPVLITGEFVEPTVTPVIDIDEEFELLDVSLSGSAWECSPGIDPSVLTVGELNADCVNPLMVNFSIITETGTLDNFGTDIYANDVSLLGSTSIFAQPDAGYAYSAVQAVCTDFSGAVIYNDAAALGGPWFNFTNNMHIACKFFIVPTVEPDYGQIELHKWLCPEDFVGADWNDYLTNCTQVMNDIEFNATLDGMDLGTKYTGQDGDGTIIWQVEGSGNLTIQETVPAGFFDPVIYCGFTFTFETEGGPAIADGLIFPDAMNGGVLNHEFQEGEGLYCDVFNRESDDPGSITVIKHTCEAGYDVNAPGANPWLDCTELTNGVTFTVQGFEYWSQSDTGVVVDGQAYFGGLIPGVYGITETIPADTWYAFAYECFDANTGQLAPVFLYDLENGTTMYVDLLGGQNLICHFMNVPELHGGTVVLTKYWCDGEIYSVWTCDIYEYGVSFDFNSGVGPIQVTTGADGKAVVYLDAGSYDLDEVGGTWCFAESSNVDWEGRIVVVDGETTYVNIFNCGDRPHKQPQTPGKFPNTGVKP